MYALPSNPSSVRGQSEARFVPMNLLLLLPDIDLPLPEGPGWSALDLALRCWRIAWLLYRLWRSSRGPHDPVVARSRCGRLTPPDRRREARLTAAPRRRSVRRARR